MNLFGAFILKTFSIEAIVPRVARAVLFATGLVASTNVEILDWRTAVIAAAGMLQAGDENK